MAFDGNKPAVTEGKVSLLQSIRDNFNRAVTLFHGGTGDSNIPTNAKRIDNDGTTYYWNGSAWTSIGTIGTSYTKQSGTLVVVGSSPTTIFTSEGAGTLVLHWHQGTDVINRYGCEGSLLVDLATLNFTSSDRVSLSGTETGNSYSGTVPSDANYVRFGSVLIGVNSIDQFQINAQSGQVKLQSASGNSLSLAVNWMIV